MNSSTMSSNIEIPVALISTFFILALLSIWLFSRGFSKSKPILIVLLIWFLIQGLISFTGFYLNTNTVPPRFLLLLMPPLITTLIIFFNKKGASLLDNISIEKLTYVHFIRVIVEIIFYQLFLNHLMPQEMTFKGHNFDIIIGLSAPFIAYFGIRKKLIKPTVIIIWNILGLVFLLNAVIHGVLSAPTPFQKIAIEQPNLAVFHFPFTYTVCLIVPIVYFSHFAVIRKLRKSKQEQL